MRTFEVTSGAIAVSDPCYTSETWCMGYLENVKNGTWNFEVIYGYEDRIKELRIFHADLSEFPDPEKSDLLESDIEVGVDSGQAGFFDKEFFDTTPKGKYGETGSFYDTACGLTYNRDLDRRLRNGETAAEGEKYFTAGVLMGRGVVSSSGFGDGCYDCLYHVDEQTGQIDAAMIIFMEDEEEDEEGNFVLVTVYDGEIEVDAFPSKHAAQDALMRDIYEMGQDTDLPAEYDPAAISTWLTENKVNLIWTIKKLEEAA